MLVWFHTGSDKSRLQIWLCDHVLLFAGTLSEGDGGRGHWRRARWKPGSCDHRPWGQRDGHHSLEPDVSHSEETCVHVAPSAQDLVLSVQTWSGPPLSMLNSFGCVSVVISFTLWPTEYQHLVFIHGGETKKSLIGLKVCNYSHVNFSFFSMVEYVVCESVFLKENMNMETCFPCVWLEHFMLYFWKNVKVKTELPFSRLSDLHGADSGCSLLPLGGKQSSGRRSDIASLSGNLFYFYFYCLIYSIEDFEPNRVSSTRFDCMVCKLWD